MKILRHIIASIKEDATVSQVLRGIHWTCVVSRYCGLASTMVRECQNEETDEQDYKPVTEMTALELASQALSDDISKASLGLAALNSLLEADSSPLVRLNAAEILLEKGKDKNISIVGHFPFVEDLRRVAANVWVIEKWQRPGDYPEESATTFLPFSDIVAISSTTLINHTLPGLLDLCPGNALKMLLGPTTPMTPILFEYGVDVISGSRVLDRSTVLKSVSEGANFRQLKRRGGIELVTMSRSPEIFHRDRESDGTEVLHALQ